MVSLGALLTAAETTKKIVDVGKNIMSETGINEVIKNKIENIKNPGDGILMKLNDIKGMNFEQLKGKMEYNIESNSEKLNDNSKLNDIYEDKKLNLTNEEKNQIKKETNWSDEIINSIGSMNEYEIYKGASLQEAEIKEKKCLIRNDIDWEQKDAMGRTNTERAEQGLSPINKDGKVIELHHIGQNSNSPLAELTPEEHRGKGNDLILHDKRKESEIDRQSFAIERSNYWAERSVERRN